MRENRSDKMLCGISVGCFFLVSMSFLLMPIESIGILPGVFFWSGLIFGVALQFVLAVRRRSFFKKYVVNRQKIQKARNGLLTFGSNFMAGIADKCMIIGLVATVVAFILSEGYGYICYVCVAITFFSFAMHCILNGRIYHYIKNQKKIRQMLEQKKANSTDKGERGNGKK